MQNKNRNNVGFTLVEVLVAVAILAIIAAPLLHVFVTAANTNAKARKVMQATTVAQNTMEAIKAYSLEDVARNMNGYTVDKKGNGIVASLASTGSRAFEAIADASDSSVLYSVGACQEVNGVLTQGAFASSVAAVYKTVGGTSTLTGTKFLGQSQIVGGTRESQYKFVLGDVHVAGTPNAYDAVITMTADQETAIANISSMNQPDCAYYVQQANELENVAEEYWKRHGNYTGVDLTVEGATTETQKSTFEDLVTREMIISYDGSTVTTSYEYDCGAGYTSDLDRKQSASTIIFNGYVTNEELKSIYVYYYPLYANIHHVVRDDITIENTSGKAVTVYLIKMVDTSEYSSLNETNYRMDLKVNDMEGAFPASEQFTTLCTNILTTNISSIDFNTVNTGDEKALVKNLGNSSNQYVKYNVSIDVYEHRDSSFSTVTVNGTSTVKFDPSDAKKFTTFTGSTIDNSDIED